MASLRARASLTAVRHAASSRTVDVRRWPGDDTIAHLVLLDVSAAPSTEHIAELVRQVFSGDDTVRAIRTSAVFPAVRRRFDDAGFEVADRLALLERRIDRVEPIVGPGGSPKSTDDVRLHRLTGRRLPEAADIDHAAFPTGWSNTSDTLADIAAATPRHRGRLARRRTRPAGFAITGLSGSVGYLQRFGVHPEHQRHGVGSLLVDDALGWLQRRGATSALVNTGVDNDAALALYRRHGFHRRADDLVVMERTR